MTNRFLKRIPYQGDLRILMEKICVDYKIGTYKSHTIIVIGYEDLNILLTTSKENYLVKLFASFRTLNDCMRYIQVMQRIIKAGVQHPSLYSVKNNIFHEIDIEGSTIKLCLMEYIDGKSFYELKEKPTLLEKKFIIQQAALINTIRYKPEFTYDTWAVVNFLNEYSKKNQTLEPDDKKIIESLIKPFTKIPMDTLPHAFVHGDILSTNVMRDTSGKLYIIDFSIANWYPRILELIVLLTDIMFDSHNSKSFMDSYNWTIKEYQKYIPLKPEEIKALPIYAAVAHAMHVLGASYERSQGNTEGENNDWLAKGRKGLKLSEQLLK